MLEEQEKVVRKFILHRPQKNECKIIIFFLMNINSFICLLLTNLLKIPSENRNKKFDHLVGAGDRYVRQWQVAQRDFRL